MNVGKAILIGRDAIRGNRCIQYYGAEDNKVYGIIELSDSDYILQRFEDILYDFVERKLILPEGYDNNKAHFLIRPDEKGININPERHFNTLLEAEKFLDAAIVSELKKKKALVGNKPIIRTKTPK